MLGDIDCVVQKVDISQVTLCRGQTCEGDLSFRGDSRWLGIARDPDRDFLACMTTSQSLIFADISFPDTT